MKNYANLKKTLLKDADIKKEYDALSPEYELVRAIIKRRTQKGLSQEELAEKMGTKQSAISRLESGKYNPSLSFLHKVADALDTKLKVTL